MPLPTKYFSKALRAAEEEAPAVERALETTPKEIPPITEDLSARDVTPPVEEPIPAAHEEVSSDMSDLSADAKDVSKDPSKLGSFAKKHGKTLAALGLVGAGTAALYSGAGGQPPATPKAVVPNRLPASNDPLDKPAVSTGDDSEDVADSSPDDTPKSVTAKNPIANETDDEDESDDSESPEKPKATPLASKVSEINFGNNSQGSAQALQDAQQQSRDTILANSLGKAGSLFGAALAKANAPDTSLYEQNIKNAGLPVEEYKQRVENEKNDPNSTYSQGIRSFLESQFGVKINGSPSAAQLATSAPWLEKAYEASETRKQKSTENQLNRDLLREKSKQHTEDLQQKNKELETIARIKSEDRNVASKDRQDLKAQSDKDKAYLQTTQLLETARGSTAVQKAENDIYASAKANSLMAMAPGGDLNNLSPQMVNLLHQELGKIASGGQSSIHELEGLDPKTFASKFAGIWQRFSNEPTAANAGAFLKQYKQYADALTKDAQKVIKDRYGRIIESRKKQIGDDNYDILQDKYINRFNDNDKQEDKDLVTHADISQRPKTVIQNGHTYTLNPQTGEYE